MIFAGAQPGAAGLAKDRILFYGVPQPKEAAMPSFDIVSQVDLQEVDNACNNVKKEIATRFDFRNIKTDLDLNRKDKRITLTTGGEMQLKSVREMLLTHCVRRKVDPKCLEFGTPEPTSQGRVKMEITVREGIAKETAQKIVKLIKASPYAKVQASIQDEQVRVTGKKIDDLQGVMALVREANLDVPVQFVNMKA